MYEFFVNHFKDHITVNLDDMMMMLPSKNLKSGIKKDILIPKTTPEAQGFHTTPQQVNSHWTHNFTMIISRRQEKRNQK